MERLETPHKDDDDLDQYQTDKKDKFNPRIPESCFMSEYTDEDLVGILEQQDHLIEVLKRYDYSKHTANRILFLFDDLVGSNLFSGAKKNPFKMLNTNHRHMSSSMIMVSQAFKEIPKTVRTQFSCLILFEIYSDSEIWAIYDEFPMGMKKDQWRMMYDHAIQEDHAFLFYNIQKPKRLRCMKNFDKVLFIKDEQEEADDGDIDEPPKKERKRKRKIRK